MISSTKIFAIKPDLITNVNTNDYINNNIEKLKIFIYKIFSLF